MSVFISLLRCYNNYYYIICCDVFFFNQGGYNRPMFKTTKGGKMKNRKQRRNKQPSRKNYEHHQNNAVRDESIQNDDVITEDIENNKNLDDTHFTEGMVSNKIVQNNDETGSTTEQEWETYWATHGDTLVWQGWLEKYPEYIDPSVLVPVDHMEDVTSSVPVDDVEEMTSEQNKNELDNKSSESDDISMESKDKNTQEINRVACSNSGTGKTVDETFSVQVDLKTPGKDINEAIKSTMQEITEQLAETQISSEQSDEHSAENDNEANSANERNRDLVHFMHDYAAAPSNNDNQMEEHNQEEIEETSHENLDQDFSSQWQALWDEHYQETYWFYFNQFSSLNEEEKQKLNLVSDAPHTQDIGNVQKVDTNVTLKSDNSSDQIKNELENMESSQAATVEPNSEANDNETVSEDAPGQSDINSSETLVDQTERTIGSGSLAEPAETVSSKDEETDVDTAFQTNQTELESELKDCSESTNQSVEEPEDGSGKKRKKSKASQKGKA